MRAISAPHPSTRGDRMPDYEIRYFRADGTLALVQITVQSNERQAHDYAIRNQADHARFELRAMAARRGR
jgi:hypothetical protein